MDDKELKTLFQKTKRKYKIEIELKKEGTQEIKNKLWEIQFKLKKEKRKKEAEELKNRLKELGIKENYGIGLITTILIHYFIGAGIAIIGRGTGNKMELYGGILLVVVLIGTALIGMGSMESAMAEPGSEPMNAGWMAYSILSILSWLYIVIRLIMIHRSKECRIKIF